MTWDNEPELLCSTGGQKIFGIVKDILNVIFFYGTGNPENGPMSFPATKKKG